MADELERVYLNRQTVSQMRRVLSDFALDLHNAALDQTTLRDYLALWLKRREGELAYSSLVTYRNHLTEFRDFLGPIADQPLMYISRKNVEDFRNESAAKSTARTANNKLKSIRVLLQAAWREELVPDNVGTKVQSLKTEETVRRGFTLDELRRVFAVADHEWQGMIVAGFYLGPRLKDIAEMTMRKVNLAQGMIEFKSSKKGRHMSVPLAEPLAQWLKINMSNKPHDPIFPRAFAIVEKTKVTTQLSDSFHDLLVKAGLTKARPLSHKSTGVGLSGPRTRNELSFHSLRYSTTSELINAGVSRTTAMDIVGHDSEAMSQIYTKVAPNLKRAALALLPDITTAAMPAA